jgi:hydrogenase nickel incorporation protein HypA/HybF
MHELSIAQNIIEIIHQYVPVIDRCRVRSIATIVGEQSGVVAESLIFSYQAITASTELERSYLMIDVVPFSIECKNCGAVSNTEMGSMQCPACGELDSVITGGTELSVKEIELEDEFKEEV